MSGSAYLEALLHTQRIHAQQLRSLAVNSEIRDGYFAEIVREIFVG